MSHCRPHVLFLTKYARNGASSRQRTFQYLPWLEEAGMECQVAPLFDEAYLEHRYRLGRARFTDIARGLTRRLRAVPAARRFDLVVIEYEALPFLPALPERWLRWVGVPYVVDYDDALFHRYDLHQNLLVRRLLGNKIARVMRGAALVTAGNEYLAEYAWTSGASRVEVIPTVVDLDRYPPLVERTREEGPLIIGWIGSPSTAKYLQAVAAPLAEVCAGGRALVRLVGSGPVDLPGVPVKVESWREDTEVDELQRFDVGIMPLPDEPWERGKCGYKLIQYMACGLPVVASPVGVNREIVQQSVNGYLAETDTEWVTGLNTLLQDAQLRRRMGSAGRAKVEQRYALQVTGPRLAALLQAVLGARQGRL
jgi:glycosyltransferase involved in cell wall biosynthesis